MLMRIASNFVDWCIEVLESDNYVILDTETTGFNGEVIELGIIDARGDILYDGLFKPRCTIEEGAMAVHQITETMVSAAPCFSEEWPEIERRIRGKSIITYNAKFDSARLEHTAKMHNVDLPGMTFYCLMQEYARHFGFQRWQKLPVACQQQGIDFIENHRALGDAFAVLEIIRAIASLAMPVVDRSAIGGLSDGMESETMAKRFQSSDVVPLDLHDWDDVRRRLQG